jgi:hypothetical protein
MLCNISTAVCLNLFIYLKINNLNFNRNDKVKCKYQ